MRLMTAEAPLSIEELRQMAGRHFGELVKGVVMLLGATSVANDALGAPPDRVRESP